MYVYPILEIDSLVKRCDQDIEKFITDVLSGKSNSIQSVRYNLYINDNYDDIKSEMKIFFKPIIDYILYEINPYITITVSLVVLNFIMILAILVILLFLLRNKQIINKDL